MAFAAGAAAAAAAAEAAVVCAVAAARRRAQSRRAGLPPATDTSEGGAASGADGGLGGPASGAAGGPGGPASIADGGLGGPGGCAGFAASAPELGPRPSVSQRDLGPDLGQAFYHSSEDGGVLTAFKVQRMSKFALTDWGLVCDLIKQRVDALPFPHGCQQAHADPCWILAGWDNRPDPLLQDRGDQVLQNGCNSHVDVLLLVMCLVPRRNDFQTSRVDSNTSPEQVARAQALMAVLAVWLTKASTEEQALVAKILLRAMENLVAPGQSGAHVKGQVHLSQVIAYSVDRGFELQLVKGNLRPVFADRSAWVTMLDDMVTAVQVMLKTVGFPVTFQEDLPPDLYSGLADLTVEQQNQQVLVAEFPRLDFTSYRNLNGETLFWQDRAVMSGPRLQLCSRLACMWRGAAAAGKSTSVRDMCGSVLVIL
jgi:hypothetical protein